jgi:UPF0716 family protein affecting phage T7 exclusion
VLMITPGLTSTLIGFGAVLPIVARHVLALRVSPAPA